MAKDNSDLGLNIASQGYISAENIEDLNDGYEYATCSRTSFILIHNSATDQFKFAVIDRDSFASLLDDETFLKSSEESIVHFGLLSEFSPYFIFLDPDSMNSAATSVSDLIIEVINVSLMKANSVRTKVPAKLKKLFLRTIRFLRRFSQGSFITEIFMRKLWDVVHKTWDFVSSYRRWCVVKNPTLVSVTELLC